MLLPGLVSLLLVISFLQDPKAKKLLEDAELALDMDDDVSQAIKLSTKAIEADPSFVKAYVFRGGRYSDQSKHKEAKADFDKAIDLDPKNAEAFRLRAIARTNLDDRGALKDAEKATELAPTEPLPWFTLGWVHFQWRGYLKGEEAETKAIELAEGKPWPNMYLLRGCCREELDRLDEALADFDEGVKINAKVYLLHYGRGRVLVELGRWKEAKEAFDKTLELKPNLDVHKARSLTGRGRAFLALGNPDKALEDFDAAAKADPKGYEAVGFRAFAKMDLKDMDGAQADIKAVKQMKGGIYLYCWAQAEWHVRRGENLAAYGALTGTSEKKRSWEPAYRLLLKLGDEVPQDKRSPHSELFALNLLISWSPEIDLYFRRGELRLRTEAFDGADDDLLAVLEGSEDPQKRQAAVRGLARFHIFKGNFDAAEGFVKTGLEAEPDRQDLLLVRAACLIQKKRWDEAGADLKKILAAAPGHLEARVLLTDVHQERQDFEAADKLLRKLCQEHDYHSKGPRFLQALRADRTSLDLGFLLRLARRSILGRLKRYAELIPLLEAEVARDPSRFSWTQLAEAREEMGDLEGAQRTWEEAARSAGVATDAYFLLCRGHWHFRHGRFQAAAADYDHSLGQDNKYGFPDTAFEKWVYCMVRQLDGRNASMQVGRRFRGVEGSCPHKPDAWTRLVVDHVCERLKGDFLQRAEALALGEMESSKKAIEDLEQKAAGATGADKEALDRELAAKRKRFEEEKAERIKGRRADALYILGLQSLGAGKPDEAKAWFEKSGNDFAKLELKLLTAPPSTGDPGPAVKKDPTTFETTPLREAMRYRSRQTSGAKFDLTLAAGKSAMTQTRTHEFEATVLELKDGAPIAFRSKYLTSTIQRNDQSQQLPVQGKTYRARVDGQQPRVLGPSGSDAPQMEGQIVFSDFRFHLARPDHMAAFFGTMKFAPGEAWTFDKAKDNPMKAQQAAGLLAPLIVDAFGVQDVTSCVLKFKEERDGLATFELRVGAVFTIAPFEQQAIALEGTLSVRVAGASLHRLELKGKAEGKGKSPAVGGDWSGSVDLSVKLEREPLADDASFISSRAETLFKAGKVEEARGLWEKAKRIGDAGAASWIDRLDSEYKFGPDAELFAPFAKNVRCGHLSEKDLAKLAAFAKVEKVAYEWMAGESEENAKATFAAIGSMKALKALVILDSKVVIDDALEGLKAAGDLEELVIQKCPGFNGRGLKHLHGLKKLSKLVLHENESLQDQGLEAVAGLKGLRYFDLFKSKDITGAGLLSLKGLPELRDLLIRHCGKVDDRIGPALAGLPALESLYVEAVQIGSEGIRGLASSKTLKQLHVPANAHEALEALSAIPALESLTIGRLTAAMFPTLRKFRSLKKLQVLASETTSSDLEALGTLTSLEEVYVGAPLTEGLFKALAGLPNLKRWHVSSAPLSEEALESLGMMKSIEKLTLSSPALDDAILDRALSAGALKRVKQLDVRYCEGFTGTSLAGMPELEELELCKCNVYSDGLKALAKLPKLRKLRFEPVRAREEFVHLIGQIKTLKRIELITHREYKPGTLEYTAETLEEIKRFREILRAALPDCEVWIPQ